MYTHAGSILLSHMVFLGIRKSWKQMNHAIDWMLCSYALQLQHMRNSTANCAVVLPYYGTSVQMKSAVAFTMDGQASVRKICTQMQE